MNELYGYKEKDVIGLAEFLKNKGETSLSKTFALYAKEHNKAKGTVRNLYYAVAKKSVDDKDFCQKYFNGKPLSVNKIIEFSKDEEKELIKNILISKSTGKSVRSAIMDIANGDAKLALRYQNKFRNALNKKPILIENIIKELNLEGKNVVSPFKDGSMQITNEENFVKLKNEINNLVSKIALREKKENEFLKERILLLERENLRLKRALYGDGEFPALSFFRRGGEQNVLN